MHTSPCQADQYPGEQFFDPKFAECWRRERVVTAQQRYHRVDGVGTGSEPWRLPDDKTDAGPLGGAIVALGATVLAIGHEHERSGRAQCVSGVDPAWISFIGELDPSLARLLARPIAESRCVEPPPAAVRACRSGRYLKDWARRNDVPIAKLATLRISVSRKAQPHAEKRP